MKNIIIYGSTIAIWVVFYQFLDYFFMEIQGLHYWEHIDMFSPF